MENAKFHHSKDVHIVFQNSCHTLRFLPAYSPQLNPIEEFFSALKNAYSNMAGKPTDTASVMVRTKEVLDRNDIPIQGFYAHTNNYLNLAIAKQKFI